mgnify:CR=1 FL=1
MDYNETVNKLKFEILSNIQNLLFFNYKQFGKR